MMRKSSKSREEKGGKVTKYEPRSDPDLKRTLRGHKDLIYATSFNPNMRQLATASKDCSVFVWNLSFKEQPYRFAGHKGPVYDVAFSPSGRYLTSASLDETVRIWANSVEGHSNSIKAHDEAVTSVSFSSDERMLLTSSEDTTVRVWTVAERELLCTLTAHSSWTLDARFSGDDRLIASASTDRTVKVWDVELHQGIHTFYDHVGPVTSVKFHPDGTCLASCSDDKKIKIWDMRSKRLLQNFDAHSARINQIAFHPSGNYLLSASADSKLKIWDLRNAKLAYTLYGHEGNAQACSFSAAGDYFATGGSDNLVMIWKSNLGEPAGEYLEEIPMPSHSNAYLKSMSNKENIRRSTGKSTSPQKRELITKKGAPSSGFKTRTEHPEKFRGSVENNYYAKLPEQLSEVMSKIVSQMDIVTKTMVSIEKKLTSNEEQVDKLIRVAMGDKSAWGASFSEESRLDMSQHGGSQYLGPIGGGSIHGGSQVFPDKEPGVSFKGIRK